MTIPPHALPPQQSTPTPIHPNQHPYQHPSIHVSAQGITQRDEMVFKLAHQLETPICMLLSGGYAKDNYRVVLASITNLLNTFSLIPGGRGG